MGETVDGASHAPNDEAPAAASESIFDADGALTREFLLARGACCGNACRNCPYNHEAVRVSPPLAPGCMCPAEGEEAGGGGFS